MSTAPNRVVRAFIAGTTYPIMVVPFTFLAVMSLRAPDSGFVFQPVIWIFPAVWGAWNVVFVLAGDRFPGRSTAIRYWLAGVVIGAFFPVLGNLFGVPGKLFNLPGSSGLIMIPIAIAVYATLWRFGVRAMNRMLDLTE